MKSQDIRDLVSDLGSWARGAAEMAMAQRREDIEPYPQKERDKERRLVARLHPKSMALKVERIIDETATCRTVRFVRTDGPLPPFRPGQYVALQLTIAGVRTSRPYSIASAPGQPHLDLTIKEKPGGFVSPYLVRQLAVGQELTSSGPRGFFRHEPLIDPEQLVFLAGGSGITPFISMIRHQAAEGFPNKITLLYGSRTEDEIIFARELAALEAEHERLTVVNVLSEPGEGYSGPRGLIDEGRLRQELGDPQGKVFFICGPEAMSPFCQEALQRFGAPRHRVRVETFGPPDDITHQPGWPEGLSGEQRFAVELEGHGRIQAAAGEPLMNALEREGVVLPAACRTGACSACRTHLLEGAVFSPDFHGLRQRDQETGYIHPCMAYPIADLCIRLPGGATTSKKGA